MIIVLLRRLATIAMTLACLSSVAHAQGRPMTIRDIVSMSSFGAASLDPGGRSAVYERRGAYDAAPAFDLDHRSVWTLSELWIAETGGGTSPERLLPASEGPGLLLGDWSPSGRRLLIYRLRDERFEAGVVEMSDRTVWWTGLTPDAPFTGSTAAWLDDDRLGLTVLPDEGLPWLFRYAGGAQVEIARQWSAQARGREPSRTVVDTRGGAATAQTPARDRSLVLLDVARREVRPLASGLIRDWAASPDGRTIAVLRAGSPVPISPDGVRQFGNSERGLLELIEVSSGRATSLPADLDVAPHLLRWTAASDALLVWVRRDGEPWASGDLARVDRDGALVRIDRHGLDPFPPGGDIDQLAGVRADWVGETPVLYARRRDASRFDWQALAPGESPRALTADLDQPPGRLSAIGDDTALLFASGGLWEVGASRTTRRSAPDVHVSDARTADRMKPVRLRVNAPPRQDWALAIDGAGHLAVLQTGASPIPLGGTAPSGETTVLSATAEAALVISRDRGRETLRLLAPGEDRELDEVNAGFADLSLSRPVPVPHLDASGRSTTSWLFLPPGRTPEEARGVVVLAYPGAVDDGRFLSPPNLLYGPRAALLASEGYAVLSPSIPVAASGSGSIASFLTDTDLAVDAMWAAWPGLPRDRTALLGHSFGGYFTVAAAGRSTRYQTYIAWAPATDLLGLWGEFTPASRAMPEEGLTLRQQTGWVEANQGGMPGPPWTASERYLEASPYLTANRITQPILLITADRDYVPMSQAERVFSVVNRQGGRARLITYWGEGHVNISPANILDVYDQILRWLDETLSGGVTAGPDAGSRPAPIPPRPRPS
jgi:dipeptidyl aminopeptidase/acylaminoacyl peptidase